MERRFVPATVHAALDYATGPTLLAAPKLLRLNGDARGSSLTPRVVGLSTTALTALSDHRLAARRVVPMRTHVAVDAAAGAALAAAPWLTGAARRGARHWLPHAVIGAKEVALALVTRTDEQRASRLQRLLGSRRALVLGPPLVIALAVLAWRSGAVRVVVDALEEAADELEELTDRLEDAVEKDDDD